MFDYKYSIFFYNFVYCDFYILSEKHVWRNDYIYDIVFFKTVLLAFKISSLDIWN